MASQIALKSGTNNTGVLSFNGTSDTTLSLPNESGTLATTDFANSLLAEYEVTGSAVTSIDFSGLDINTHKSYRIEVELVNATASNSFVSMYINGDTTATNYYNLNLNYTTTVSSTRTNDARALVLQANDTSIGYGMIQRSSNGYAKSIFDSSSDDAVNSIGNHINHYKTAIVANITQLTFTASVALSIGVGSKIRIYRGDV